MTVILFFPKYVKTNNNCSLHLFSNKNLLYLNYCSKSINRIIDKSIKSSPVISYKIMDDIIFLTIFRLLNFNYMVMARYSNAITNKFLISSPLDKLFQLII